MDCADQQTLRQRLAKDLGIGKSTPGKWIAHYRSAGLISTPQRVRRARVNGFGLENRVLKESEGYPRVRKLHAVADANGRPISFFMTAGQIERNQKVTAATGGAKPSIPPGGSQGARSESQRKS